MLVWYFFFLFPFQRTRNVQSHALSYAQLVWQLAYQKAHYPHKFWRATLKNVVSCYRPWVHLYEAKCVNVTIETKQKNKSIYALHRNKNVTLENGQLNQLKKYGYWNMKTDDFFENCYYFQSNGYYIFKGLIAASRTLNYKYKKLVLFVWIGKNKYIEVVKSNFNNFDSRKVIVKGKGKLINHLYGTHECYGRNIVFI